MKFISKKKSLFVTAALGLSLFTGSPQAVLAAEQPAYTQENLNAELTMAVAWMQNSAEYRELCYQAYNTALDQVVRAVAHHKDGDKPLAIVLDADETVVDNSAFEAGLIGTDNAYSNKNWDKWCAAAKASAMPGAANFLQSVDKLGVDIFYVTNRSMDTQYEGSAKNMKAMGFPQVDRKHMLFKTDTSNKQPRYDEVSKQYEVVVYLGDNAGDLPIGTYHKGQAERNAIVDAHKSEFGHRFIALPNPSYGDWEPALKKDGKFGDYWKLTPKEKSEARNASLKKWNPVDEEQGAHVQSAKAN